MAPCCHCGDNDNNKRNKKKKAVTVSVVVVGQLLLANCHPAAEATSMTTLASSFTVTAVSRCQ
jgi:hypothetical protein